MKKIIFCLVLITLILSCESVHADSKFELRLGVGVAKLSKPQYYTDYAHVGPSVHAGLSYQMTSFLGLLISVDFHRNVLDKEKLRENLFTQGTIGGYDEIRGGNSSVLSLSANTLFYIVPRASVLPVYVLGGGGYFKLTTDQMMIGNTAIPKQSEIAWTVVGGAGIDVPLSTVFALFFEGKYGIGYTKAEQSHYLSGTIGMRFDR